MHLNAIQAQISLQDKLEPIEDEEKATISDLVRNVKDQLIIDSV